MILNSVFPIAVATFNLGRDYTPEENAFIDSQETHKNKGNTTSNDRYVLKNDVFANIKTAIEKNINQYFHAIYAPKHEVNLRITQSWLNYCQPGEWHHKHAHPNSFISGVLYMKAARERDKIYFHREGYQQIKLPTDNWNLYNSESWWFAVGAGDMVIFPSSLTHSVEPVQGERVSLSFNTFPVGYIGEENTLTALHLEH